VSSIVHVLKRDLPACVSPLLGTMHRGPLPIPSFDTFVGIGDFLSAQVGRYLCSGFLQRRTQCEPKRTHRGFTTRVPASQYGDWTVAHELGQLRLRRQSNAATGLMYKRCARHPCQLDLGGLHFAPDNADTWDLIDYLNSTTTTFSSFPIQVHKTETAAVDYVVENALRETTWAVITLGSLQPDRIDFTIRMNSSVLPNTNFLVNWISIGLDTSYQNYVLSGFLTLQETLYRFAVNRTSAGACSVPSVVTMPFPTAAYRANAFYTAVGFLLGLAVVMATLFPVSKLLKDIVEEKETRMRETMKIMGLRVWVLNLSWFLTATVMFFIIGVVMTWLMTRSFLSQSSPSLVFFYIMLFLMTEIAFVFLLSTFFSKAKLAAILGPVSLFGTVLPRYLFFGTNRYEAQRSKYAASLLSATAFTFGGFGSCLLDRWWKLMRALVGCGMAWARRRGCDCGL
jgi:hypothetical protein